jgi:hypothetical protein
MVSTLTNKRLIAAVAILGLGTGCRPNDDISSANGDRPKGPMPSNGLGNLNNTPDADPPLQPTGIKPWPDGGSLDGSNADIAEEMCAAETQMAKQVPVDLLRLLDRSGSMVDKVSANGRSKWELAQVALMAFIKDSKSAGLGVGIQYFPLIKPCVAESDCGFPTVAGIPPACHNSGVCAGPGNTVSGLPQLCGARRESRCPLNQTCVPFGHCSETGALCFEMGMPCPNGPATNVCGEAPKVCRDTSAAVCAVADYEKLPVAIGELPMAAPGLLKSLATAFPVGGTPTDPAVEAGLNLLRARAAAHPERHEALVVVTDGLPNSCRANPIQVISGLIEAARMGMPSIPTYAIGVFGPTETVQGGMTLGAWATAGGTGTPFVLTAGDDLTQKLIDALNQIRGAALPCEYQIPMPASGTLDYGKVNVRVTNGTTGVNLLYVGSADKCDPDKGGWYYDADPAVADPKRVIMCEATCKKFKMDTKANIEIGFGCKTIIL